MEEETIQRGGIKGRVYREYLRAGPGPFIIILMILFTIISQTIFHGSDIFLTYWTKKNEALVAGSKPGSDDRNLDIIIYSVFIVVLFVSTIIRATTFFAICMSASVNLHNKIFARMLRAPVAFFDSNPAGRILNRFTRDLGIIDELFPAVAYDLNMVSVTILF